MNIKKEGIHFVSGKNIIIDRNLREITIIGNHNVIQNQNLPGLYLIGDANKLTNLEFKNLEVGLIIEGKNNIVENSSFIECQRGILDGEMSGSVISNNFFTGNLEAIVFLYKSTLKNEVINNQFIKNIIGINLSGKDNKIKDNYFYRNQRPYIITGGENLITQNQFYENDIIEKGSMKTKVFFNIFQKTKKIIDEFLDSSNIYN